MEAQGHPAFWPNAFKSLTLILHIEGESSGLNRCGHSGLLSPQQIHTQNLRISLRIPTCDHIYPFPWVTSPKADYAVDKCKSAVCELWLEFGHKKVEVPHQSMSIFC